LEYSPKPVAQTQRTGIYSPKQSSEELEKPLGSVNKPTKSESSAGPHQQKPPTQKTTISLCNSALFLKVIRFYY
jgi:hypothetical protein